MSLLLLGCVPAPEAAAEEEVVDDTGAPDTAAEEEPSACADAEAHIAECEGGQGRSPYRAELEGYACESACVTRCVERASCEELAERGGQEMDPEGECPVWETQLDECLYECDGGCITPLTLSFDGAPIALGTPDGTFDFGAHGRRWSSWPAAANPWLVLDRNGNGTIDDASELFGDATILPDGRRARNGFEALAALDTTRDGRITAADTAWSSLALWSDDGDRVCAPSELVPLAGRGVTMLDLGFSVVPRCDAWGNCERERSAFTYAGPDGGARVGALVDVYLRTWATPSQASLAPTCSIEG